MPAMSFNLFDFIADLAWMYIHYFPIFTFIGMTGMLITHIQDKRYAKQFEAEKNERTKYMLN